MWNEELKTALEFAADGGVDQKWYKSHECAISIDLRKILYLDAVKRGDDTTCNFSHPENFVVLECIDRLFRKGYRPADLHIGKKWSLGRTQKSGKADIVGKRVPKGSRFENTKTEYPYIRVSDLQDGTVNIAGLKYVSPDIFRQIANYTIGKDDVYISIAGTIGLVGTIPPELDGKSLTENVAKLVIRDKNQLHTEYLAYILSAAEAQKQISERTRALGVPKLALDRIKTIKIPVPEYKEQLRIVKELDRRDKRIRELKVSVAAAESKKEAILENYL